MLTYFAGPVTFEGAIPAWLVILAYILFFTPLVLVFLFIRGILRKRKSQNKKPILSRKRLKVGAIVALAITLIFLAVYPFYQSRKESQKEERLLELYECNEREYGPESRYERRASGPCNFRAFE